MLSPMIPHRKIDVLVCPYLSEAMQERDVKRGMRLSPAMGTYAKTEMWKGAIEGLVPPDVLVIVGCDAVYASTSVARRRSTSADVRQWKYRELTSSLVEYAVSHLGEKNVVHLSHYIKLGRETTTRLRSMVVERVRGYGEVYDAYVPFFTQLISNQLARNLRVELPGKLSLNLDDFGQLSRKLDNFRQLPLDLD